MLIPVLVTVGGYVMTRLKTPNSIVGYRTERSMKSEDAWLFANRYCGKLWQKLGIVMFVATAMAFIPLYFAGERLAAIIGCVLMFLQLAVVLFSIYPVEKALKENFNPDSTHL